MARVTVEDCIKRVPNRFELVLLAVQRARNLGDGSPLAVLRDSDKNPVIALREIAEEKVSQESLWQELEAHFRPPEDKPEDEPLSEAEALFAPSAKTAETQAAEGDKEEEKPSWSEEDMLKALQKLEGQPAP